MRMIHPQGPSKKHARVTEVCVQILMCEQTFVKVLFKQELFNGVYLACLTVCLKADETGGPIEQWSQMYVKLV